MALNAAEKKQDDMLIREIMRKLDKMESDQKAV
jgi:hypothetical protein